MRAMVLRRLGNLTENPEPLEPAEIEMPVPGDREVLIKVSTCGICHTELDEIEGRTPPPKLPVILGHQVVGRVAGSGPNAVRFAPGTRVGVGWIFSACGNCDYCRAGEENLCADFRATGRDVNGGYAEYMTVPEESAYPIPEAFTDSDAAPLLCAGAIGYRSLRLAGLGGQEFTDSASHPQFRTPHSALGLTGFGASAHLVLMMARYCYPDVRIFVFARDESEQAFARELGANWAGDTGEEPPDKLDAIIDTTPVWTPIVEALKNLKPGGRLVVNAIRKEDKDKAVLQRLDYAKHVWMEKEIKSVANVTRRDIGEFLELAAQIPIRPETEEYPLEQANQALLELKQRRIRGAKVLRIG